MPDYRFIIEDRSGQFSGVSPVATAPSDMSSFPTTVPLADTREKAFAGFDNDFFDGAGNRVSRQLSRTILSPLNSATGGLASPTYNLGKSIATGASSAAIGGAAAGLAIAAVMLAINKMQERIAKMEAQAGEANNRDNLLIRAGMVHEATFYKGDIRGVRKTTRD